MYICTVITILQIHLRHSLLNTVIFVFAPLYDKPTKPRYPPCTGSLMRGSLQVVRKMIRIFGESTNYSGLN